MGNYSMINIKHRFVETIPKQLEEKILYVTIRYNTVVHKCFCGCGQEVVTPLSPTDWKLTYNGKTVSLYPSIGNWSFKCQSHYWIRNNRIEWAPKWSDKRIKRGRNHDKNNKQEYFNNKKQKSKTTTNKDERIWRKFKGWIG